MTVKYTTKKRSNIFLNVKVNRKSLLLADKYPAHPKVNNLTNIGLKFL